MCILRKPGHSRWSCLGAAEITLSPGEIMEDDEEEEAEAMDVTGQMSRLVRRETFLSCITLYSLYGALLFFFSSSGLVSPSDFVAMALYFRYILNIKDPDGTKPRNWQPAASSFFFPLTGSLQNPSGQYNKGFGLPYEGKWITFDGEAMSGCSRLQLENGESMRVISTSPAFKRWLTRVMSGEFTYFSMDMIQGDPLLLIMR